MCKQLNIEKVTSNTRNNKALFSVVYDVRIFSKCSMEEFSRNNLQ